MTGGCLVARIGTGGVHHPLRVRGEEFIVLLGNISLEGGLEMAERLREKVEAHIFSVPGPGEERGTCRSPSAWELPLGARTSAKSY